MDGHWADSQISQFPTNTCVSSSHIYIFLQLLLLLLLLTCKYQVPTAICYGITNYSARNLEMSLVVHWYDAFCFAILGLAVLLSIYVLSTNECNDYTTHMRSVSVTVTHHTLPSYYNYSYNNPHLSSSQLWSSCWRRLHPAYLFVFRLLSFFVLAFFLSWDIQRWGASIFIYYTEWTFALVMLYFAIGSVISAYGCWLYYSKDSGSHNGQQFEIDGDIEETRSIFSGGMDHSNYYQQQAWQRAGFWGYLMQTAYQTCAGAVILTDIVFWGIIVPLLSNARLGLNLLMGCMHTVNIVLLLLDTSMNRLPFPWFRIAYFVLWSSAYVVFQWLIHLLGFSWWPYPFLKLSTPWAPLWYLILAISHVACYGLYAVIVRVKDSLFTRLFPDSYIRSV